MNEPQEGVQTPEARIEDVLRVHRATVTFAPAGYQTCACGFCFKRQHDYEHHIAAALTEALGLSEEWGFKSDDESHPFSVGTWDRTAAVDAANYNNARWGDKYHAMFRYVSKWQWETFYDGASVVVKTVKRRPTIRRDPE